MAEGCFIKAVEPAIEAAQHHGLTNTFSAMPALDQCHTEEVTVCAVGVHVGSRLKVAEFGGTREPLKLLVYDENITIGKEQQQAEFWRKFQFTKTMADIGNCRCCQKSNTENDNCVGFYGDKGCQENSFNAHCERTKIHQIASGIAERQSKPEKKREAVHHQQSHKDRAKVKSGKMSQQHRQCKPGSGSLVILAQSDHQGQQYGTDQFDPGVEAVKQGVPLAESFKCHLLVYSSR